MSAARILIVAPNADLRRSLAFALGAEGYVVTSHAAIPAADAARGYDCVVLDHRAAQDAPREQVLDFVRQGNCVVLLAGTPQPWLTPNVSEVVPTPVLGRALTGAVSAVLARREQFGAR